MEGGAEFILGDIAAGEECGDREIMVLYRGRRCSAGSIGRL